jgi:hypothetical protein
MNVLGRVVDLDSVDFCIRIQNPDPVVRNKGIKQKFILNISIVIANLFAENCLCFLISILIRISIQIKSIRIHNPGSRIDMRTEEKDTA